MTDRHRPGEHAGHDDALRARLAAADPAVSLPPAAPDRVARLLEDTMAVDTTALEEPRTAPARRRTPLTWVVAAAAAVVIAGAGVIFVNALGDDSEPPIAGDPAGTPTSVPADAVTVLAAGDPADSGRCMPPTADLVASQDVAFLGIVEEVGGGAVTLGVEESYAGTLGESVELRAPAESLQQLIGAVGFEVGGRYLVSAVDDRVSWCGLSGPATPGLQRLYDQAFPR